MLQEKKEEALADKARGVIDTEAHKAEITNKAQEYIGLHDKSFGTLTTYTLRDGITNGKYMGLSSEVKAEITRLVTEREATQRHP